MTSPSALTALLSEGIAHQQAGRLMDAEGCYRRALAAEPGQPNALHLLATIALQAGKADAALDLILRALPHIGHRPQPHNNLGLAYMALRRLPPAEAAFRQALAVDPHYPDANANLAAVLMESERYGEAEAACRQALNANPDHIDALIRLGDALEGQGRLEDALAAWRRSLAFTSQALLRTASLLVRLDRFADALKLLEPTKAHPQAPAKAHYLRAVALNGLGRIDEGQEALSLSRKRAVTPLRQNNFIPPELMVQMSRRCNLRCTMCGHEVWQDNTGFISEELFDRVLEQCATLKIPTLKVLAAQGEPFLHPKAFELLERAVKKIPAVHIVTNGTPLTPERISRLANLGLATVQFSFGGYDKESYEGTYVGGKFAQVSANLKNMVEAFAASGSKTLLSLRAVSREDSGPFIERTRAFLQSLGAPSITTLAPNNFAGTVRIGEADPETGIHSFRSLKKYPLAACSLPLTSVGIFCNGVVTACGCYDANGALAIGDLAQTDLAEILQGDAYLRIIAAFESGDIGSLGLCAQCDAPYGM